jgi:hypothetical protein
MRYLGNRSQIQINDYLSRNANPFHILRLLAVWGEPLSERPQNAEKEALDFKNSSIRAGTSADKCLKDSRRR